MKVADAQKSLGEMQNAIVTVRKEGQATKSQDMKTHGSQALCSWQGFRSARMCLGLGAWRSRAASAAY